MTKPLSFAHLHRLARRLAMLHALPPLELQAEISFDGLCDLSGPLTLDNLALAAPGVDFSPEFSQLQALQDDDANPGYGPAHAAVYAQLASKLLAVAEDAEHV